jgi:hypothetical protein
MLDNSMNFNDVVGLDDIATSFNNPLPMDNSFSIGEIMQQKSTMNLDTGSGIMNTSSSINQMSQGAEQSSRNFLAVILPKQASSYVFSQNHNT